jgi:hypothetical protein
MGERWDGWSWYRQFKRRHHDTFHVRRPKPITIERTSTHTRLAVEHWISDVTKLLDTVKFTDDAVLNADETGLSVNETRVVLESKQKKKAGKQKRKQARHITLIPFVTATGNTIVAFYVFPIPAFSVKSGQFFI